MADLLNPPPTNHTRSASRKPPRVGFIERWYQPLPPEEGGGFVAVVPDLPGCIADGETREEAARDVANAISEWLDEANRLGRAVPAPSKAVVLA